MSREDPEPWQPITDKIELAILGKLQEELGELLSAIARVIIQGMGERHPTTGKINLDWVREEIADVEAGFFLVLETWNIDIIKMLDRKEQKIKHLRQWHSKIIK